MADETNDNRCEGPIEPTDRSLLDRFRSGVQDAATSLYFRYAQRLHKLTDARISPAMSARVDPEGIVQSVFRTFFRRAAAGQYDVADGEELWKLLLVIALNKIRTDATHHRAGKRDVERTQPILDETNLPDSDSKQFAMSILKMTIDELLSTVCETDRRIVLLRIEGHDVGSIARQTRCGKRSVERVIQRFRNRLEKILE